jgi:tetratricopeptide (TPR) repeat protein
VAHIHIRLEKHEIARHELERAGAVAPDNFRVDANPLILNQRTKDARAAAQQARFGENNEKRAENEALLWRTIEVRPCRCDSRLYSLPFLRAADTIQNSQAACFRATTQHGRENWLVSYSVIFEIFHGRKPPSGSGHSMKNRIGPQCGCCSVMHLRAGKLKDDVTELKTAPVPEPKLQQVHALQGQTEKARRMERTEEAFSPSVRMPTRRGGRTLPCILALFGQLVAQQTAPDAAIQDPTLSDIEARLNPVLRVHVDQAIQAKDYLKAEQILVREIDRNPHSAELLKLIAGVFFLDGKYLNVAIALKKAEKISTLDDQSRFTLAMSYVVMNRHGWARPELEKLHGKDPANVLYLYWLGRLDYDSQHFPEAAAKLEQVVALKPDFMKAHDNLGLCYEALGRFDDALKSYERAGELNRNSNAASPWPPMNLGALLLKIERVEEAEKYLSESLRINSRFAPAHYELGVVFERKGRNADAVRELEEAAALDVGYAQPHYALGRIHRKVGNTLKAEAEFRLFEHLRQERPGKAPP